MQELADLPGVERNLDRIRQIHARGPAKIWVRGSTGSGRGTLADRISAALPTSIRLDLLGLGEADAVVHGLLQWEASIGSVDAGKPIPDRARRAATLTAKQGRVVVLKVPTSWDIPRVHSSADQAYQADRLRSAVDILFSTRDLGLVLLTGKHFEPPLWPSADDWHKLELPAPGSNAAALEDDSYWGDYAAHARAVRALLPQGRVDVSPLMLRLAVGIVALCHDTTSTPIAPGDLRNPRTLFDKLVTALRQPRHVEVRAAVARLSRARTALPTAKALEICRPPRAHTSLLTQCVGYGDAELRVTDDLRRTMYAEFAARTADHESHGALASHHRSLDGCTGPAAVRMGSIRHWLEKTHHLAHAGEAGRAEWERQELLEPEFFIDRARALSIEEKDYLAAADLYRRCTVLVPTLAYPWHYLGFNLACAGRESTEAERAFRKAVALDPENPWWNGRLVNFLIERAQFRAAEEEWKAVGDRVDADREQVRADPWLARELHRWVTEAWLRHGEVARAREVMREVPAELVAKDADLARLEHRLCDAEEVRDLGASVHPPGQTMSERWKPHNLPERDERGMDRTEWFPGRVVRASTEGVELVFAVPADDPSQRRVLMKTLTGEEWRSAAGCPPELARGYVEIGTYGDPQKPRIVPVSREFMPQPENESDLSGTAFVERLWGPANVSPR